MVDVVQLWSVHLVVWTLRQGVLNVHFTRPRGQSTWWQRTNVETCRTFQFEEDALFRGLRGRDEICDITRHPLGKDLLGEVPDLFSNLSIAAADGEGQDDHGDGEKCQELEFNNKQMEFKIFLFGSQEFIYNGSNRLVPFSLLFLGD